MKYFRIILPGLLVAATGVGAGDLITAGLAGHHIGLILWVPLIGALLKYALTEGIARYQFATNDTLIHGWVKKLGPWVKWPFVIYLVLWSYTVGGALINACATSLNAIFPLENGKIIYGTAQSLLAVALILPGNFKLFENIMAVLVAIMFATVIGTSFFFLESPVDLLRGLTSFGLLDLQNPWFIGVLGGVGGTLTIICYGYWLQESKRSGKEGLKDTKIDLAISYTLTGLFSMSMIIIGTQLHTYKEGGESFIYLISELFQNKLGYMGKVIFQWGFFAGVFSSLLGVWQSVPYLFADIYGIHFNKKYPDLKKSPPYRVYLILLGLIPLSSLTIKFQSIQLIYAVMGALFIPLCALSLLLLNNKHIEQKEFKNSKAMNLLLVMALLLFAFAGLKQLL